MDVELYHSIYTSHPVYLSHKANTCTVISVQLFSKIFSNQ